MKRFRFMVMLLAVMLLAMCGEVWADVAINATNFPDEAFRNYISNRCDTDKNGNLSDSEISSLAVINTFTLGVISSLKGIEYFTPLQGLRCDGNRLTELDVSKNTALTRINCADNQLTTLDLSKNTALTELYCQDNKFTTLDLSNNKNLRALYCDFGIATSQGTFSLNLADFLKKFKFDSTWEITSAWSSFTDGSRSQATINTSAGTISGTYAVRKTLDYVSLTFDTQDRLQLLYR